jgi:predicted kinase
VQTMWILRGVAGSGKSTLAKVLAEQYAAVIASADDYPGLYTPQKAGPPAFDMSKIGLAHGACFVRTINAVQAGRNVIVDNTNTTALECAPYVSLAQAYGASPVIVTVEVAPSVAFARQSHGVPMMAFNAMVERLLRWETPPHWRFIPGFAEETRTETNA